MDQGVAAGESGTDGLGFGEIAYDGVARYAFNVRKVAGFANEKAKICALGGESLGHMVADEAGSACKEYLHERVSKLAALRACSRVSVRFRGR
jgi:hypothetical protein